MIIKLSTPEGSDYLINTDHIVSVGRYFEKVPNGTPKAVGCMIYTSDPHRVYQCHLTVEKLHDYLHRIGAAK